MCIGIDLDNTLANYEGLFYQIALAENLIPPTLQHTKTAVRDFLRNCGREEEWTRLQGEIYGPKMHQAPLFSKVLAFFEKAQKTGMSIKIISHRSKHPYAGPKYDLHQAAKNWLKSQGLLMPHVQVSLNETLAEKLEQIKQSQCAVFIDDLPELLTHEEFPKGVNPILFDPKNEHSSSLKKASSWNELSSYIFS